MLQELLSLLRGPSVDSLKPALTQLNQHLHEVISAIDAVEDAHRAGPPALSQVERRVTDFSFLELDALALSAGRRSRVYIQALREEVREALERLATSCRSGATEAVIAMRPRLVNFRRELEALAGRIQREARRFRIVTTLLVLLPTAIATAAAWYLRRDAGLDLVGIEGIAPAAAYELAPGAGGEDGRLELRKDFVHDYMAQFSRYYFGRPNRFQALYGKDEDEGSDRRHSPTLLQKIVLRNESHAAVRYISSVEVLVETLDEAPFPWERLDVTAHLSITAPHGLQSCTLNSVGIGPAVDLEWTAKAASGLVLGTGTAPLLLNGKLMPLKKLPATLRRWTVKDGQLANPLFRRLDSRPSPLKDDRHFQVTGTWYEEIRILARLREVARVAFDEPWSLEVRFSSLRDEPGVARFEGHLGQSELIYEGQEWLLEEDPRSPETSTNAVYEQAVPPVVGRVTANMLKSLADPNAVANPKGVDLVVARLDVDLNGLSARNRTAVAVTPDAFLNPQGVLAAYLTLSNPSGFRYAIALRVNGEEAARYQTAALAPSPQTFKEEGADQAVARLRKVFGVKSTARPSQPIVSPTPP